MRELRAFLNQLRELKIRVWEEDGKLRINAPKGAVTPEIRDALKAKKEDILDFFRKAAVVGINEDEDPITPAPDKNNLPLSFAQQRLWFLDQLEGPNPTYNLPTAIRFKGKLDVAVLRRCGDEIARRHESARTRFVSEGGKPRQVVDPPGPADFQRLERPDLAHDENALTQFVSEEFARPFDLAKGPLLRQRLIQLGEDDHVLVLVVHHIISDGWSQGVLVAELTTLYRAFTEGRPSPLPELSVQYGDFAHWQRQKLSGDGLEKQVTYWRDNLYGAPALLEMPTDRPRPAIQRFHGDRAPLLMDKDLSAGLNALAQETGCSLFMVTLAIYQLMLSRYSGQDDITVGSPMAGRNRKELEPLLGFFVNTLVLRTNFGAMGNVTFREALVSVRSNLLDAYAHQDVPFERLVEELVPGRQMSHSPLFQVMFVLQNNESGTLELPGLELSPVGGSIDIAKFDLTLSLNEIGDQIAGNIEFNVDLFDLPTIEAMGRHYLNLARQVVDNVDNTLDQFTLLSTEEREGLLDDWQPDLARYNPEGSIIHRFNKMAAAYPERIAITMPVDGDFPTEELTYDQLNRRANRIGRHLRDMGVGPEDRVGLCVRRSLALPVSILGILKSGAAYVPLDPAVPADRLAFIAQDAELSAVLCGTDVRESLPDLTAPLLYLDGDNAVGNGYSEENPPVCLHPESNAYVIYTSGSTGKPKGCLLTHWNVLRLLDGTHHWYQFDETEVWSLFHSFAFDVSVWEIWGALLYGGRLVVVPQRVTREPAAFYTLLCDEAVTVLSQTPSAFYQLIQAEGERGVDDRLALRWVVFGGEALEPKALIPWYERHADDKPILVNMYGITEVTVHATFRQLDVTFTHGNGSMVGVPFPDLSIPIMDRQMQPSPVGIPGEMLVGGYGPARGYHRRPALTAQRFVPDPFSRVPGARLYRSGDLARWSREGDLEYLGRIDFQIQLRGFRVELGEIEACLRDQPGVRDTVVLCREDRPGDQRLVAYVVLDSAAEELHHESDLVREWRKVLSANLPEYMVPAHILVLDTFPLTANGKLDRRALPAPVIAAGEDYEPPAGPTEELLANIWADVLGAHHIGRRDNFFTLGGHSLLATQVMSRLRDVFNVELPVRATFEAPVLADMAERIDAERAEARGSKAPPIKRLPREDRMPFSFAQERLWFLDQLEGPTSTYNMPTALELAGVLDFPSLERALQAMVDRHEILRTTYEQSEGIPYQCIAETVMRSLPVIDLSNLADEVREQALASLAEADALNPFNLKTGPLLRLTLVHLSDNRRAILLNMHHIISDGWSMGVFVTEFIALYNSFSRGEANALPPLPFQYADFAGWQRSWLSGEELDRQVNYWKEKLGGELTTLEFPTDRPRPAILTTFNGAKVAAQVDDALGEQLNQLARRHGASLFMVLLSAFKLMVARICGQYDVTVGTPIAGRNRSGMENLIGCFLNSLVLRTDLSGDPTFAEVIGRVRETSLGAYEHADLPFEKLLEELHVERDRSRTPLFQIFFNMLNLPEGSASLPDLELRPLTTPDIGAKFDLELYVSELPNGSLNFSFSYNTDLFDAVRMQTLADQYTALLSQLAANPEVTVAKVNLMTPATQDLLPNPEEPLSREWQGSVVEWFERAVARREDHPALVFKEDESWSYEELGEKVDTLAQQLAGAGLQKGDHVAIYAHRGPELAMAILGTMKAGGVFVMLDPAFPAPRLIEFLDIAKPKAWLQMDEAEPPATELTEAVTALNCRARFLIDEDGDAVIIGAKPGEEEPPEADVTVHLGPDDAAVIAFTSGSTGRPKGILGRHGSLTHFLPFMVQEFELSEDDRYSMLSGLSHDPLQREIFTPLSLGATLCIPTIEDISPGGLARWYDRHGITFTNLTPAMNQILTNTREDLKLPLKTAFLVGDRLTGRDASMLRMLAPEVSIINTYGSTETQRAVGFYRLPKLDAATTTAESVARMEKVQPLGVGMKGAQMLVLNSRNELCGVGELGEIYMRSPHMALGYLDDPQRTAESFLTNPFTSDASDVIYKTGDLGRYLPDGNVAFHARADFQLKIRGFRIEPGEIEAVLESHQDVTRAVVMLREEQLVAYVQCTAERVTQLEGETEGDLLDKTISMRQELNKACRDQLPGYMCPAAFKLLEHMPLTPNRKIDRKALLGMKVAKLRPEGVYVAPRNNIELKLANIWEDLLGVTPIGVTDNWFELGGHSMLAVQLMAHIKTQFDKEFYLASLFSAPTVEGLAAMLMGEGVVETSTVVTINEHGDRTPFFCLHPGGGTVLCYQDMSQIIGPQQPFYGVQSRVLLGKKPLKDLKEMVAEYITNIKEVQPEGPYRLGGWSLGGLLAFETARQMEQAGDKVELLVIMDTYPLALTGSGPIEDTGFMLMGLLAELSVTFGADLGITYEDLKEKETDEQITWVLNRAKQAGVLPPEVGAAQLDKLWQVFWANHHANHGYTPGDYGGKAVLIKAKEKTMGKDLDLDEVWGSRCKGGLDIHWSDGNHSNMVNRPHVEELARIVAGYLEKEDLS